MKVSQLNTILNVLEDDFYVNGQEEKTVLEFTVTETSLLQLEDDIKKEYTESVSISVNNEERLKGVVILNIRGFNMKFKTHTKETKEVEPQTEIKEVKHRKPKDGKSK